jgi:hypothetical protein
MTPTTHARQATKRLVRALVDLAARGLRTHCSDAGTSELWLSEHEGERAEAAILCIGCPVIQPCGEAAQANDERWGVWAGVDRTRRPGKKGRPPKDPGSVTGLANRQLESV